MLGISSRGMTVVRDRIQEFGGGRQHLRNRLAASAAPQCAQRHGDPLGQPIPPVVRLGPPGGQTVDEGLPKRRQRGHIHRGIAVSGDTSGGRRQRPVGRRQCVALGPPALRRPHRHQRGLNATGADGQHRRYHYAPQRWRFGRRNHQQRTGGGRDQARIAPERPLHARGETPQPNRADEHEVVGRCQRAKDHSGAHLQRDHDDQRHASARTVLQRDGTGDCRRTGRPHRRRRVPVQRDGSHRQDPEQAASHGAGVRGVQP